MIFSNFFQRRWLAFTFCFAFATVSIAQPVNPDCASAIFLPVVSNWCSDNDAFDNINAGASAITQAACFVNNSHDVWFTFFASATNVNVTVDGLTAEGLDNLLQPEVALYTGECNDITLVQCITDTELNGIVELFFGSMIPGQQYWLRVDGRQDWQGHFGLCVSNFDQQPDPDSDCITATLLCNKSAFTIPFVAGGGSIPDEAEESSCLGGLGIDTESNSAWFSWTAANNGDLTFELVPTNPEDDLDFVLYELPDGIGNCISKQELRCMASGDLNFPSICMGSTGLDSISVDTSEPPGCTTGDDNFLAPLDMTQGTSYALMVNNYTSSGNGFSISFGGTGEFVGPEVDFTFNPQVISVGETVTFMDNSSFPFGMVTSWEWSFGTGATPQTANTSGPHSVSWSTPCTKQVSLTITTDSGCTTTISKLIEVMSPMNISISSSGSSGENGIASISASGGEAPYTYLWDTGETTSTVTGLTPGTYSIFVFDNGSCMIYGETVVEMLTSNEEISLEEIFEVYPNPASDQIVINTSFGINRNNYILISDIYGRVLAEDSMPTNSDSFMFDVSWLPTGLYFISINDGERSYVKEFIKTE